ncbi:MAG: hypothetical protein WC538_06305 [Thermoanaerobaculia bacterium]|jgi:hypothetical protein
MLGPVDLTKPGVNTFRLAGLPKAYFVLGFDVTGKSPTGTSIYDSRPISTVVRLTLTDEQSRVIIDEVGPLDKWTWSGSPHHAEAFVYRQGEGRDVPLPDGSVGFEALGVKPDEGFGSAFSPRPEGVYSLQIEVVNEDPRASAFVVKAMGKTGGWE